MTITLRGSYTDNLLAGDWYWWHDDCFRCNTCDILLDEDSSVGLPGDGPLICKGCIHSHSVSHVKIEDLVIFTGDQVCFKCRHCNKKIENLKYARTSQGIFCMDCHESLMERRQRKALTRSKRREQKAAQSLSPEAIPDDAMTLASTPRDADPATLMNFF